MTYQEEEYIPTEKFNPTCPTCKTMKTYKIGKLGKKYCTICKKEWGQVTLGNF